MSQPTADRRRHPRHEISVQAALHAGGVVLPCRVRNISAGGILIEVNAQLRIGDRATVMIPDFGTMAGWVVRVSSTTLAIAFEEGEAVVERLIAAWLGLQAANASKSEKPPADEEDREAV